MRSVQARTKARLRSGLSRRGSSRKRVVIWRVENEEYAKTPLSCFLSAGPDTAVRGPWTDDNCTHRRGYDFINRPAYAAVKNVSDSGVREPNGQNLDVSFCKSFSVWEDMKLQLRFEGYNVMNHPQWQALD